MSVSTTPVSDSSRLSRLQGYLEHDPENLNLLADTAEAAFDEGEMATVTGLVARYAALTSPPAALRNLAGLAALKNGRFDEAADMFARLYEEDAENPVVRANLAWARSALGDYAGAIGLLDEAAVRTSSQASTLKVHVMHHLGLLDEALAYGGDKLAQTPDDAALSGALAMIAIDSEDIDLARVYAKQSSETSNGASALGLLCLNDNQIDEAEALFDKALDLHPQNPRALLGKGMGLLLKNDPAAAEYIDRGAEIFGDHLGSWVAAGWAHFARGDYAASRVRFETAMALDDTFAESQGALAVLDVIDGDLASAKRRADVALRLDRQCLSAALAKSLILEGRGKGSAAEKIRITAMNLPVGAEGQTIAQTIAALGLKMPGAARP